MLEMLETNFFLLRKKFIGKIDTNLASWHYFCCKFSDNLFINSFVAVILFWKSVQGGIYIYLVLQCLCMVKVQRGEEHKRFIVCIGISTPSKTPPPLFSQAPHLQLIQSPLFMQYPLYIGFFMNSPLKLRFFCGLKKY